MSKKGDLLAPAKIISLVLAILGFTAIIIFLLHGFDFSSYSEDELCHNSIIMRGSMFESAQGYIPLKCTTKKICLTTKLFGGDCPQFAGEKNIKKIRISSDPQKGADEIEEQIANSLYDCWRITGEGKLDLFGGGKDPSVIGSLTGLKNLNGAKSTCLICSRVALATDISEETLEKVDVNEYMKSHKVPGSDLTYIQKFTNNQVRSYPKEFEESFSGSAPNPTNELAIIFMQILTEEEPFEVGTQTAVKTGAFIFAGRSALGPLAKIVSFKATAIATLVAAPTAGALAAFQTYNDRLVSAGYCGEFIKDGEEAKNGCSIVTAMDYQNIEKLNNFCSRIEGNP